MNPSFLCRCFSWASSVAYSASSGHELFSEKLGLSTGLPRLDSKHGLTNCIVTRKCAMLLDFLLTEQACYQVAKQSSLGNFCLPHIPCVATTRLASCLAGSERPASLQAFLLSVPSARGPFANAIRGRKQLGKTR